MVTIHGLDRWTIYHRLQQLSIPCECKCEQPLQVPVADVLTAIQVWSVAKQITGSRAEKLCWLQQCWEIKL